MIGLRNNRGSGIRSAILVIALLSLSGCFVGALFLGGAATLAIKQGFIDEDTYGGVIKGTPGKVYSSATEVMNDLCHKITLEKAFRKVSGSWGGADIEVTVEDVGGGEVSLNVKARKYLLADKDTAVEVFQKILRDITEK